MFFKYHGIVQYNIMGQDVPMTNMTKSSIVIDNSGVASLQKELFDHLWETLA